MQKQSILFNTCLNLTSSNHPAQGCWRDGACLSCHTIQNNSNQMNQTEITIQIQSKYFLSSHHEMMKLQQLTDAPPAPAKQEKHNIR